MLNHDCSRITADCGGPHKKKGGTQHRWSTCAYTLDLCLLHTVSVTFAEWCAWQVLRIALASLSAASQPQLRSCLNVARTSGSVVQNGNHPSVYFFQPRFASEARSDHVTSAYPHLAYLKGSTFYVLEQCCLSRRGTLNSPTSCKEGTSWFLHIHDVSWFCSPWGV